MTILEENNAKGKKALKKNLNFCVWNSLSLAHTGHNKGTSNLQLSGVDGLVLEEAGQVGVSTWLYSPQVMHQTQHQGTEVAGRPQGQQGLQYLPHTQLVWAREQNCW